MLICPPQARLYSMNAAPGGRQDPLTDQRDGQILNNGAADDRTGQDGAAADDDPDQDLRALTEAEHFRRHEIAPDAVESPCEAGDHPGDDERPKLVDTAVVTQKLGAPLILPDRDQHASPTVAQSERQTDVDRQ